LEMGYEIAYLAHRDRVDAGQWLVEQDEMGLGGERPSDLASSALAPRKGPCRRPPPVWFPKIRPPSLQHCLPAFRSRLGDLKDRPDILLDGQPPEYRCLLRQVADA